MRTNLLRPVVTAACAAIALWLPACCGLSPGAILDPLCNDGIRHSSGNACAWEQVLAQRLHRPIEHLARARSEYAAEIDPERRRELRDQISLGILSLIDEHHQRSGIALAAARAGNDVAADLAVIGLTTAASLTSGAALKSALAAAASATTGANLAINERFLSDLSTSAILTQMDVEHAWARQRLVDRLLTMDDRSYPLALVEVDLLDCLYAGTPVQALASLADTAALRRAELRDAGNRAGRWNR